VIEEKMKSRTGKNSKAKLISILIIGSLFIAVNVFLNSIVTWGASFLWHISNDDEIIFHDIKLNLPVRFWVKSKDEDSLVLHIVPPYGLDYLGIVIISRELITKDDLLHFKERETVNEEKVIQNKIETRNIGTEEAIVLIQKVVANDHSQEFIYELWTIPSKSLTVLAIRIPQKHRNIYLDLFTNISFM
jgi:hypothetical protein